MSAEIINLRQARKNGRRIADRAAANANAVRHGTPPAVRDLAQARADKASRDLEAHRVVPDAAAPAVPADPPGPDGTAAPLADDPTPTPGA